MRGHVRTTPLVNQPTAALHFLPPLRDWTDTERFTVTLLLAWVLTGADRLHGLEAEAGRIPISPGCPALRLMFPSANHFWEVEVSREERISFGKQKSTGDPSRTGRVWRARWGRYAAHELSQNQACARSFPPDTLH